jgi:hypothetical protein
MHESIANVGCSVLITILKINNKSFIKAKKMEENQLTAKAS